MFFEIITGGGERRGRGESLTGSVVRVQTDDELLRETFWNSYNKSYRKVE